LAQQHYESFKDRFADTAVRIEVLSRFGSNKTHLKTIEDLAEGKVDIVVGTHKILQENIQFKNLGLMIVMRNIVLVFVIKSGLKPYVPMWIC
jgi:transcription-repair coupling factor (superfamily II helicase)